VPAGRGLDGVRIALDPAAGLEVWAPRTSGRVPRLLTLAGRDAAGRRFIATRIADPAGPTRFADLPAGQWRLLIAGTGSAPVEVDVEVPGEPLRLTLPDAGKLVVRVADHSDGAAAGRLTVAGSDGRQHRHLAPDGHLEFTTGWNQVDKRVALDNAEPGNAEPGNAGAAGCAPHGARLDVQ